MSTADFDLPRSLHSPAQLAQALRASHATTLSVLADLAPASWIGVYLPCVNPPLWELGHVAWFLERWVMRREGAPSSLAGADAFYDSSRIAHVARWFLPLPSVTTTLAYLEQVTDRVVRRLESSVSLPADESYFVELAIFHQDMHNEAFRYTWQTLGYTDPLATGEPAAPGGEGGARSVDIHLPRGTVRLGARRDEGFVFDNEKWSHEVEVDAFSIDSHAVSNGQFRAFVDAGGYQRREFWCDAGWAWRVADARRRPRYWRVDGGWQQRRFNRWLPLDEALPVMHVNAFEAEAYCRWARRRLPSEAEWMRAAACTPDVASQRRYPWGERPPDTRSANLDGGAVVAANALPAGDSAWGLRQMLGNLWEWTASPFFPFPGFAADPYADYSRPWFGSHRVLRGGSFATAARLARNGYRNFYQPHRADVFCGFRTCALP